jgi:hypothetical protein
MWLSLSNHLWIWPEPGTMDAVEELTSHNPVMTLLSALVVIAMVWAEEAPLETKA